MGIVMLGLMLQCGQCGHENNPEYRFCGMCGARLQSMPPPRQTHPPERTTQAVSGPSFLGLADDQPSTNFQYLLEDDAPSGHGRMLVLLLLLVTAGFIGWRWHRDGYPWARPNPGATVSTAPPAASTPVDSSPPAAPPAAGTDHPEAAPGAAPASEKIDLGPLQPAPQATDASNAAAPQAQASPAQTPETKASEIPNPKNQAVETDSAKQVPPQSKADSDSDESAGKQAEPAVQPAAGKKAAPASKVAEEQPTNPSLAADDRLVLEGEKYLYGNGVRQSCERAQKDLFAAAQRANPKAQSVLGAMYATGHCVNRDLPSAYRWFAKALRQEPGNDRVAQDLQVLWKQMTPAERQAASHSGQ
jgi:hypothetical protein